MVIGIDASRANKLARTGTEWYSYYLIEELKQIIPSNVTVRLYTREPLRGSLGTLPAHWEMCVLGWPPKYLWTLIRLSVEMWRRPPDVLFVPAHGLPLLLPKRAVSTIHDIGFDRFPKLYKKRQIWYHRFAVRRSLRRCARIITISAFTRDELKDVYGSFTTPIDVIPLAVEDRFFAPVLPDERERVRQQYRLAHQYLLFIGRLEYKKNVHRIIESYARVRKQHPDLDLVLIGPWGFGRDTFEAQLQRHQMGEQVHILSWVPQNDVAPLLSEASVLLFPTLYEGFGLPILEAMTLGVPVVTSNRGAHKEVASDAALLVNPEEVEEICRAVQTVIEDSDAAKRMSEAGRQRAAQFTWRHTAEATWDSLRRATGSTF